MECACYWGCYFAFIQMKLAGTEVSRVLCDVTLNRFKLLRRADQVVEALLLPEAAFVLQFLIDLLGRESLSRRALSFDVRLTQQADHQMDVIRHHHEIAHVVTHSVKVQQALAHELTEFLLTQHTRAISLVQRFEILP